jgi:hypothetical protein
MILFFDAPRVKSRAARMGSAEGRSKTMRRHIFAYLLVLLAACTILEQAGR